jgi:hypothetical protein
MRSRELRLILPDVAKSCVILNWQQMYSDAYFHMHLRDCAFFSLDTVFSGMFQTVLQSAKSWWSGGGEGNTATEKFSDFSTTWSSHMFWPPVRRVTCRYSWLSRLHQEETSEHEPHEGRGHVVPPGTHQNYGITFMEVNMNSQVLISKKKKRAAITFKRWFQNIIPNFIA